MNQNKILSNLLLLLTAIIWGVAFVAQSVGMDYIGPFTFNAARFLIGGIVLLPFVYARRHIKKRSNIPIDEIQIDEIQIDEIQISKENRKITWLAGICCGIAIFAGSTFQQLGILHTTVGKAGFITALYIIIVPILGIFLKKKAGITIWISAGIAICGFYLLCIKDGFSLSIGDLLVLICAVFFSIHILVIDYFAPQTDGVEVSCIQFLVSAFISGIIAFAIEDVSVIALVQAYIPILYAGIMSCGVAYTFQIIGQKNTEPAVASLILSFESVVAVLAGWIILGQSMSIKEILGALLVFAAILLAQKNNFHKKGNDSR